MNRADQWAHIKERQLVLAKLEKAKSRAKAKVTFYDNKRKQALADYRTLSGAVSAENAYYNGIVDEYNSHDEGTARK